MSSAGAPTVRVALSVITAMHELALREAFPRLSAFDFATLRSANRRLADALRAADVDTAIAADDQFHSLPVAATRAGWQSLMPLLGLPGARPDQP